MQERKHIIVIGAGFGGLKAVQALRHQPVNITLIDKTNHHLFQPLLYQVAVSALAPGEIAVPVRTIFNRYRNVRVLMGEVVRVDRSAKQIMLENGDQLSFDYLILAPGARHSYFGNDHWEKWSPGLKTLSDALQIRENILLSLEKAEREDRIEECRKHLTFVIVGGGPTGVEMAGAIAEIVTKSIREDYKNVNPDLLKILLVESHSRILAAYSPSLSERARSDLEKMGVSVHLNTRVTHVDDQKVQFLDSSSEGERSYSIETGNVIWAAGNRASPLLESLNMPLERDGRLSVEPDLSVPGHPCIFVIGDAARHSDQTGKVTPGIAPAAIQQGAHSAKNIVCDLRGHQRKNFVYLDKGSMATIGRARAIAQIGKFELSGIWAWLLWSVIHIVYLIRFRNRIRVMAEWIWYYLTFRGGSPLITRKSMNSKKEVFRISEPENSL